MNDKFPVLAFISKLLKTVGWLAMLPGFYFLYKGSDSGEAMELGTGCLLVLCGLAAVALGEIVGVLFAIELNTRKAK